MAALKCADALTRLLVGNQLKVRSRFVSLMIGAALMANSVGCAGTRSDAPVYFVFELRAGDTKEPLRNIHYSFGTELVDRMRPVARPGLSFQNFSAQMAVPARFDVTWDTSDGRSHSFSVPVRELITESVRGKTLLFVLQDDSVEGYIAVLTPAGQKIERRFY